MDLLSSPRNQGWKRTEEETCAPSGDSLGSALAVYLAWRNHGIGEDYRYAAMRRRMGPKFAFVSLFQTFLLQAGLNFLIGQSLYSSQLPPSGYPNQAEQSSDLTTLDHLGTAVWAAGFFFETVGDIQLAAFKSNPENKGKLMNTGLWKYTRHPNYFGNSAMFWGYYLISCAVKGGWKSVFSPGLMTYMLMKVSGVALLERGLSKRKPGFAEYVKSTSSFVPWFPGKT
eukprot:CAMPEP_0175168038 /NCGR_PEP_ID=MMETSP0087-20121206/28719_1 /TAXON_ID=136419 /ORGANISM="Unknown Unknown, Strain D1" /LENGTH=226 /DNA_ID=CAMNT_0016458081 /DNA_START=229 /DNA_END=910 /DNA_ORIENTATION=+